VVLVGFEPTNSEESGFTVRRVWPLHYNTISLDGVIRTHVTPESKSGEINLTPLHLDMYVPTMRVYVQLISGTGRSRTDTAEAGLLQSLGFTYTQPSHILCAR
jgi:hypothetical protein